MFLGWLANSVFHSMVAVLFPLLAFRDDIGDHTGQSLGVWYKFFPLLQMIILILTESAHNRYIGSLIYTVVIILVTLKLVLEIRYLCL